jgi:hypothetical protein
MNATLKNHRKKLELNSNFPIFVFIENEKTSVIGASGIKGLLKHLKTKGF